MFDFEGEARGQMRPTLNLHAGLWICTKTVQESWFKVLRQFLINIFGFKPNLNELLT